MSVKYGRFEMPKNVKIDRSSDNPYHAKFIFEPLERGAGHTFGSPIRRLLLTSLEAISIVAFKLEGIPHEFTAIDGVIEDMTQIVLNLKGALIRGLNFHEHFDKEFLSISKTIDVSSDEITAQGGQYSLQLKHIIDHPLIELVNPDLHIFYVTAPFKRTIDLRIGIGRGYVPCERIVIPDLKAEEIILDAAYSPVKMANYFVEHTRVGQDTEYDRLIVEITTDGRILPEEALSFVTQIIVKHMSHFYEMLPKTNIIFSESKVLEITDFDQIMSKLILRINEIELTVRSTNCLESAGIEYLGELAVKTKDDMLAFRNFGKKSLHEIEQKLQALGLDLGVDLSKYEEVFFFMEHKPDLDQELTEQEIIDLREHVKTNIRSILENYINEKNNQKDK